MIAGYHAILQCSFKRWLIHFRRGIAAISLSLVYRVAAITSPDKTYLAAVLYICT